MALPVTLRQLYTCSGSAPPIVMCLPFHAPAPRGQVQKCTFAIADPTHTFPSSPSSSVVARALPKETFGRSPAHTLPPSPAQVIARALPNQEIHGIREMFKAIDEDNSGCITIDELRTGLKNKGAELALAEVRVTLWKRTG